MLLALSNEGPHANTKIVTLLTAGMYGCPVPCFEVPKGSYQLVINTLLFLDGN